MSLVFCLFVSDHWIFFLSVFVVGLTKSQDMVSSLVTQISCACFFALVRSDINPINTKSVNYIRKNSKFTGITVKGEIVHGLYVDFIFPTLATLFGSFPTRQTIHQK